MLEFQAKRYVKVRLKNGFIYYNTYGLKPQSHVVRAHRHTVFAGLILDFATGNGYTHRTAAGLGLQTDKRKSKRPNHWGKKGVCNNIYMLDDLVINKTAKTKELWLDMQALGAPNDWNGKLALTLYMEDICPNRSLELEVLAVADKLPAGAAAAQPIQLGKLQTAVIEFKKITGKPTVKNLQSLGNLHATKLTMAPLKTQVHAGWDDKNLYFHYTAEEVPGRKPNTEGSKINKPWFCDSVEFFAGKTNDPGMLYHMIIDTTDCRYAEDMTLLRKAGDKNIIHPGSDVKTKYTLRDGAWTCLITVPWSVLGGKPEKGKLVPFNLMRNRLEQGKSDNYTLVPGKSYFTGNQFQFKLVD